MRRPTFPTKQDSILFTISLWWLGNVFFGLIPLLTVGVLNLCNLNKKSNNLSSSELIHFLEDGGLDFFFLAIIGSIAVDIYSARRNFKSHFAGIMIFLALAVGGIVAFIYMAFLLTSDEHSHFGDMKPLTIGLGIVAFIYCTIGKISLILIDKQ